MVKLKTGDERVYQWVICIIVGVVALCSLYPIIYVLSISVTSQQEWVARKGGLILFPSKPTLMAYKMLMKQGSMIYKASFASVLRTVVGTVLSLMITIVTGYTVSKRNLPGRKFLLIMIVFTLLFGGGLIPTYLVVQGTGLLDSFWALIIPGMLYSWGVLVFKQFFEGIPQELEESAYMDGAGEFILMQKITLPMSLAPIAAIGLFIAVGHWNAWFDAMIYLPTNQDMKPLQLILRNMFTTNKLGVELETTLYDPAARVSMTEDSTKMAVAVIGTVPILMVYPFLQKHFVKGVYTGSVKG